jgi:fatty acid desaturase
MLAHSSKDIWIVFGVAFNLATIVLAWVFYDALPFWALVPLGAFIVFLGCTNFQCLAHNHIHNPIFKSRAWNRIFAILNTIPIGIPFTLYRFHHLNHHAYTSDPIDPETGETKDLSSIYRYSKVPGEPEHILAYAFLSHWRSDVSAVYGIAQRKGLSAQVWMEAMALAAFILGLGLQKPRFLLFYVPVYFLVQMAAYAANYTEHFNATPGNRLTDSVSCYGAFYNFIWLNNGYHQEHHYRPQVHWTKVRELRAAMLPETERYLAKYAHWFNVRRVTKGTQAPLPSPELSIPQSPL